eukprot:365534-Chlamydomonas_euryale.AAC.8
MCRSVHTLCSILITARPHSSARSSQARTKLALRRAEAASAARDASEAREAVCSEHDGSGDGGRDARRCERGGGGAAARPWTRFVFDKAAPLDEEGGRPSLAFLDERSGGNGGDGDGDGVGAVSGEGLMALERGGSNGGGAVNALSFRQSADAAAEKRRNATHDAAIFGGGGSGNGGGGGEHTLRADRLPAGDGSCGSAAAATPAAPGHAKFADLCPGRARATAPSSPRGTAAQQWLQAGSSLGTDEDGPVVVTEEELRALSAGAAAGVPAPAAAEPLLPVSAEVREQQATMTWRERAMAKRMARR